VNIEHIGIYAKDSAALADWYAKSLLLDEVRRIEKEGRPPVVFLKGASDVVIEILPTSESAVPRELSTPGFTHLGIVVDDLGAEQARLAELGVEMWGIRATSNGWKIGYFHDPEGNTLELIQR
jgi:catechol 2,3-dioxygenase-like lactoylglutathione lyase family enzyme